MHGHGRGEGPVARSDIGAAAPQRLLNLIYAPKLARARPFTTSAPRHLVLEFGQTSGAQRGCAVSGSPREFRRLDAVQQPATAPAPMSERGEPLTARPRGIGISVRIPAIR